MLTKPPRESIWISWLYVVLCALAIFATVPFGRRVTEYIDQYVDDSIFTVIVVAIFAVAAFGVIRFLIRRGAPALPRICGSAPLRSSFVHMSIISARTR